MVKIQFQKLHKTYNNFIIFITSPFTLFICWLYICIYNVFSLQEKMSFNLVLLNSMRNNKTPIQLILLHHGTITGVLEDWTLYKTHDKLEESSPIQMNHVEFSILYSIKQDLPYYRKGHIFLQTCTLICEVLHKILLLLQLFHTVVSLRPLFFFSQTLVS